MTQDERLLDYLKDNKHIDPLQAWTELGIYRLSACIFRLRQEGWEIETEFKNVLNSFDEKCHVANYKMEIDNMFGNPLKNIDDIIASLDGYTPDEISQVIDPEAVKTLNNAMKNSTGEK